MISFVKTSAYLPEYNAYGEYCDSKNIRYEFVENVYDASPSASVVWQICGLPKRPKSKSINVHEYQSLSTPPLSTLKDSLKTSFNFRPDYRVFLNKHIHQNLNFRDSVPYIFRDMGVHASFFKRKQDSPEYKFVYAGSLTGSRRSDQMLEMLAQTGEKSLIIGTPPNGVSERRYDNITFTGRVAYSEVPNLLLNAEHGVNYIPDIYPFNIQTSTKLLEYCAAGLKIVSTSYQWARQFESNYGGKFFYLSNNSINLNKLEKFEFKTPDVRELEWQKLLAESMVFEKILSNAHCPPPSSLKSLSK